MHYVEQLEKEFGEFAGVDNCVACSNGTTALHLALEAFQFPPGSRVLIPEFTMIACARAVTMAGLIPVPIDCGDDLNICPEHLELHDNVRSMVAIIPTAIYGRGYNQAAINCFARRNNLMIIEDLAEYHGGDVNYYAQAHCWSFYKNKIVAGEEGGLISFSMKEWSDRARQLRCQGFTPEHDFNHIPRGINGRLSNANAKLILESLNAEENLAKRTTVEFWYSQFIPDEWKMPYRDVVWVYDIKLPSPIDVDYVVHWLNKKGVQARHAFKPISSQTEYFNPEYKKLKAWEMSQRVMYLPVDPRMTEEDVKRNCELLMEAVEAK